MPNQTHVSTPQDASLAQSTAIESSHKSVVQLNHQVAELRTQSLRFLYQPVPCQRDIRPRVVPRLRPIDQKQVLPHVIS